MTAVTRNCEFCNEPFQPTPGPMAGKQRFCSTKHRVYASRKGLSTKLRVTDDKPKATTEAAVIDWNTLPGTAKAKLERAERRIRRELELEFKQRVRAEVEAQTRLVRNSMRVAQEQAAIVLKSRRGVMTRADYDVIRSCLHPDSRASVSDEKLASAFRVFNDSRIKTLLVKEKS